MEILEVTPEVFDKTFPNPRHIFNSGAFSKLNETRFEKVYYLIFKDTKIRMGIIFGLKDKVLLSPFSATFGGFEFVSDDVKLYQIDSALHSLFTWASANFFLGIKIISPPFFYKEDFSAKVANCLYRAGFEVQNMELNYHFQTTNLTDDYEQTIWYNAKKNLKKANDFGLSFEKLNSNQGKLAYDIIVKNRSIRGFPLQLTWEQLVTTSSIIPIDFFLVKVAEVILGAAIVYHMAPTVVRVIYWGDVPELTQYKTMNFLSYQLFNYYKNQGIKYIDIGHSTVNSVPNNGLCEFKESIGCDILTISQLYKKLDATSINPTKLEELETSKALRSVDATEFNYYFSHDSNPFISEKFINLNAHKVDRIVRLVQNSDKVQVGLIAGIKDNVLRSPFSAPFGGFHCKGENIYISVIDSFIQNLIVYAHAENITKMYITLPPDIYCQRSNAKIVNALTRLGFQMQLPDITNWVDLREFNNAYTHNASRTYYNQAVHKKLTFAEATTAQEKEFIYTIITDNRARKERPIYMTFDDILLINSIFPLDFFTVKNANDDIVAGAILYRAHPEIVYALFWGDSVEGRSDRAMDFLIFNLLFYYKSADYSYIDLGTSTEAGTPNEGLIRFKETHECLTSLRYTFTWTSEKQ